MKSFSQNENKKRGKCDKKSKCIFILVPLMEWESDLSLEIFHKHLTKFYEEL